MYFKVYEYNIQPDKLNQVCKIDEEADAIYSQYFNVFGSLMLQKKDDLRKILTINWYSNEKAYEEGIEKVNADPRIKSLFSDLISLLDPEDSSVTERDFNLIRKAGQS